MRSLPLLSILLCFFYLSPPIHAEVLTGKVVHIADGDTFTLLVKDRKMVKVRMEGIDAPEAGQEYGSKAKKALSDSVFGKEVSVQATGTDKYGRTLGWVIVAGQSINRKMVADGWAWQYTQYNKDPEIAALQESAKKAKKGLWAAPNEPMAPWDFRHLPKAKTETSREKGSNIEPKVAARKSPGSDSRRYWINSNGVRHNSSCRWYGRTKRGHFGSKNEGRRCDKCGG